MNLIVTSLNSLAFCINATQHKDADCMLSANTTVSRDDKYVTRYDMRYIGYGNRNGIKWKQVQKLTWNTSYHSMLWSVSPL